ncbi:GntR family transcriptional regulator [Streptomyces sp. NPDC004787]|uniref:GntR family transcriptional regulator n=1 Tax=Streptomyces sp. NPDC004787 TaxID=3154291 RepID=UPI0033ADF9D6
MAEALYRYFDAERKLLYLGVTSDPARRDREHRRNAADLWYPLVAGRGVDWYDTREEAEAAERRAIREEKPRFNDRHNVRTDPLVRAQDEERRRRRFRQGMGGRTNHTDAIVEYFSGLIDDGLLGPGDQLPLRTEIVKEFGVSAPAVTRAYLELVRDGRVEERRAHGYYVLPPEDRRLSIRVGRPQESADVIRGAMSPQQISELIRALAE